MTARAWAEWTAREHRFQTAQNDRQLVSVGRAAQILRCSARMVRAYIAAGELTATKIETTAGHQWVMQRGEVLRLLVVRNTRLQRRPPTYPAQLRLRFLEDVKAR